MSFVIKHISKIWNHRLGPKTVHFWAPVSTWCLVLAFSDIRSLPAEEIDTTWSRNLLIWSFAHMRLACVIQPANPMLFACHVYNTKMHVDAIRKRWAYEKSLTVDSSLQINQIKEAKSNTILFPTPSSSQILDYWTTASQWDF